MEPTWEASWAWGLPLIALTIGIHAFGVALLALGMRRLHRNERIAERLAAHSLGLTTLILAVVGCVLAMLHGLEALVWAVAYLALGAVGSMREAMLYSVDSITTRGSSGILLSAEYRMLGALEAADGMLLFGISTAFAFALIERIMRITPPQR